MQNNNTLVVYVDASYDWTTTKDGAGEGLVLVCCPQEAVIKRHKQVISVPGLKQLNNRFELLAIHKGIEFANNIGAADFIIYSDSKTAVSWANKPFVKWIPREKNDAGILLDKAKQKRNR